MPVSGKHSLTHLWYGAIAGINHSYSLTACNKLISVLWQEDWKLLLTHEMTGESLAADTLAIVWCVRASVFLKEQRRLNVRLGARSWVLLKSRDCPGDSYGVEGEEVAQALAQHKETSEISLKVQQSRWRMTGGENWGNRPSLVGGWVWERGEGVSVFARPLYPCCLVLHRYLCGQQWGLQHLCQASVSSSYSEISGTECIQSASCCSGWEVVLVVPSGAGLEMALWG